VPGKAPLSKGEALDLRAPVRPPVPRGVEASPQTPPAVGQALHGRLRPQQRSRPPQLPARRGAVASLGRSEKELDYGEHGVSEEEHRHRAREASGSYGEGKRTVPIDLEAEEQELEAAGWERLERLGKVIWRNPKSGYLYPQGAAIALIRAGNIPGASEESGGKG
jgi:hypothetical protein